MSDHLGTEPRMAMCAYDGMGALMWFYPDDLAEARELTQTYGAVPFHPWPESGAPSPVFPWTKAEVEAK